MFWNFKPLNFRANKLQEFLDENFSIRIDAFIGLCAMKQVYIKKHGMSGEILIYGRYISGVEENIGAGFLEFVCRDGAKYTNYKNTDIENWDHAHRKFGGSPYEIPKLIMTDKGAKAHTEMRKAIDNKWGLGTYHNIISNPGAYEGLHQEITEQL